MNLDPKEAQVGNFTIEAYNKKKKRKYWIKKYKYKYLSYFEGNE